jgi:ABC-type oligopeptide transport system substrate-binding subunit
VARIVVEVEALGGHVKDLAGDGVLALFGAPVSYEDDAERAVRAALRIVDELGLYGDETARGFGVEGFGVRIGIATGPVVLGDVGAGERIEYAAFGDTVNTAARLQAAAPAGGVLVDERTHRLVEPLFAWNDTRELELKGKSQPVVAHRVGAAAPTTRGARRAEGRFVGRERELALARSSLDALRAGAGTTLFVTGEAGIGKSRLLRELRPEVEAADAHHGRALWLEGRCVSYGDALPYWPFRDLLRSEWLGVSVGEPELRTRVTLRRHVRQLFGERELEIYPYLATLLGLTLEPDAAPRLAELSPEALQYRTFEVVQTLFLRLAEDGPLVVALEDLHWADATSVQLVERLLPLTEQAAIALLVTQRTERDHASWRLKEIAAREYPHLFRELDLEPLGDAQRELLDALAGDALPPELERRVLDAAEGNPFYLEELVRSLVDAGALERAGDSWRFVREAPVEVPETVEKVIAARIDRLPDDCRRVLTAAATLGRRFGLPLLEGVLDDGSVHGALHELQRLELVLQARRWPEPEYRFKHALIQETAYRTILSEPRTRLHRRAAEWLEQRYAASEDEVLGLLAHHWLAAANEDKAIAYLARAGDKARQEYALDEAIEHYRALLPLLERRGENREAALVLFKLALALHTSLRFREANAAYQRAFEHWSPPLAASTATETLRIGTSFMPTDADPTSAIAWPNIQLCMQLFDRLVEQWPERTIVPSLAERWEIADDGLRYVFHLRDGLRWSDGTPLTAHDVEYGIKRVLDPVTPGSSVAIYFVLENAQDYYLGHRSDADAIGVRALDDRTLEFRLAAPAPYFMSVMNRPDGGPQPRHCIEAEGAAWTAPGKQVVSGAFAQSERMDDALVLVRRDESGSRRGNVGRIEFFRHALADSTERYARGELDIVPVRYTPRLADVVLAAAEDAVLGGATWTAYLAFDHHHPMTGDVELRRALAYAIDRDALAACVPENLVVASGGVVPPALQGHTPDIAVRYDPDRAREHFARAAAAGPLALAALDDFAPLIAEIAGSWHDVLGVEIETRAWTWQEATLHDPLELAPIVVAGWLPGYPDPEYYLRLLLHSDSRTNEGGFAYEPFDDLIERARRERDGRTRLELFHEADRLAIVDRVALIPLVYGRSMAFVKPWVDGWWEFGKTSASFADLTLRRNG